MKTRGFSCLLGLVLFVACESEPQSWVKAKQEQGATAEQEESGTSRQTVRPPEAMTLLESKEHVYQTVDGLLDLQDRTIQDNTSYDVSYYEVVREITTRLAEMELTPEQATRLAKNAGSARVCVIEKILIDGTVSWRRSDEIVAFARLGRNSLYDSCSGANLDRASERAIKKLNDSLARLGALLSTIDQEQQRGEELPHGTRER